MTPLRSSDLWGDSRDLGNWKSKSKWRNWKVLSLRNWSKEVPASVKRSSCHDDVSPFFGFDSDRSLMLYSLAFLLGLLSLLGLQHQQRSTSVFSVDAWPDWPKIPRNVTAKWNLEWFNSDSNGRTKDKGPTESKRNKVKKSVEEVMALYKARLKEFRKRVDGRIQVPTYLPTYLSTYLPTYLPTNHFHHLLILFSSLSYHIPSCFIPI